MTREWGHIYILMADSRCCMAETNTTLQNNYSPIKNKLKKRSQGILIPKDIKPHTHTKQQANKQGIMDL